MQLFNSIRALFFLFSITVCNFLCATDDCPKSAFLLREKGNTLTTTGDCTVRHAPFSTFKVPLALMGFDAEILHSKDSPQWSFSPEYEANFQSWYTHEKGVAYNWCQDHTPATFMKYSVVWFSHQITARLGAENFQTYINNLDYGNRDVSGTPGKDDALINSWLGTSLQISPREQVEFLEKLLAGNLQVSPEAQQKTREIMDRGEEWDGWNLYGKTGGGADRNGWFVGWVEKEGRCLVFAQYLDLNDQNLDLSGITLHSSVGLIAKDLIRREITQYLS